MTVHLRALIYAFDAPFFERDSGDWARRSRRIGRRGDLASGCLQECAQLGRRRTNSWRLYDDAQHPQGRRRL